jgi:hypothetical protein
MSADLVRLPITLRRVRSRAKSTYRISDRSSLRMAIVKVTVPMAIR